MVKMVDVASHASVSVKTVSRVLNNEPHVQDKIRERVMASVKELGYVPSSSARNLRSRRTYALHLIAHSVRSNFINAIQSGALLAAQQLGYNLFYTYLDGKILEDEEAFSKWCTDLVTQKRPDGVILVPPYTNSASVNKNFAQHKIPILRVGPNNIQDCNTTVTINDRTAAKHATNHLIELGHRRIAFIRGLEDQDATHERFKGYCDALELAGIPLNNDLVFPGDFGFETGMMAGEKILNMEPRPSAVFAANDDMAAGVIVAAHKSNVEVPDDISVIGFDDSELATRIWPRLTTIRQPRVEYGERAVELLISMTGSGSKYDTSAPPKTELMDYELVIRESTGKLQT